MIGWLKLSGVAAMCLSVAPVIAARSVTLRNDPAKTKLEMSDNEAIVVALLDDPDRSHNRIQFQLYDLANRKLVAPVSGEKRTYGFELTFRKIAGVAQDVADYVGVVPAGDYVLIGEVTDEPKVNSFCFGSVVIHLAPGSVSFVGGYRPMSGRMFPFKKQLTALKFEGDLEQARSRLDGFPTLKEKLVAAPTTNGATFDCTGDNMWAYRVPGAPDLPAK